MRWPWRRPDRPLESNHTDRLPDGDRVLRPGQSRLADLLREVRDDGRDDRALREAAQPLPQAAPLLIFGGCWRMGGPR